jgi:hypothetical protein
VGGAVAILIARAQHPQQRCGVRNPPGPFGDRLSHAYQVGRHLRVDRVVADPRVAGEHDERRMPPHGLVHHPDAVAEADAAVQLDHGGPARRAGVAVRDADCHLLEGEDVAQRRIVSEGVEETLLDGPRIAEQKADVVGKQLLEKGEAAGADAPRWYPPAARGRLPPGRS